MSIKLRSIRKSMKKKEIFSGFSLDISDSEFLMLKGKSEETQMFLDILHGVEKISSGSITISGYDVSSMPKKERIDLYRTAFGVVSQDFEKTLSVSENISLSGIFANMSKKEKKSRTETMAKNLGIFEILNKKPKGLKKNLLVNVMVARACFMNPKIILASEPTKGFKKEDAEVLLSLLKNYAKSCHAIVIIASNDELVEKFATKVLTLQEGKLA